MSRLVDNARAYLGTPFAHRGRSPKGLDCAGLVWRAYADAGLVLPDVRRYGREPHRNGMMLATIAALGDPLWEGRPGRVVPRNLLEIGDVLVMRFVIEPHHMAIVTPDSMYGLGMIHADGTLGVRRVVEHGMDDKMIERICAVFRRPI